MTVGVHGYHTTFQDPHGVRRDFSRAPRPSCRPSCRTWKPRVYALAKGKADSSKKASICPASLRRSTASGHLTGSGSSCLHGTCSPLSSSLLNAQEDERGAPHDKPHQGGLTASLLFNVSAWGDWFIRVFQIYAH